MEALRLEQWRRVLDLNVVAVAHLTALLLPALRAAVDATPEACVEDLSVRPSGLPSPLLP